MRYIGWCLAFISISIAILTGALNHNQSYEIEYQKQVIEALRKQNNELKEKQKQIDWMKNEVAAIDNYIMAVECLRLKGAESLPDNLEETIRMSLNEKRYEVIKKAVAIDRENK